MDNKTADAVAFGRDLWDVPVRVELRAYLRFNRRMDGQMRRLVDRWRHLAAPKAREADQPPKSGKRR